MISSLMKMQQTLDSQMEESAVEGLVIANQSQDTDGEDDIDEEECEEEEE